MKVDRAAVGRVLAMFMAAVFGTLLVLGAQRAYRDYSDFCTMRQWVAAVQAAQQKAQPPPGAK